MIRKYLIHVLLISAMLSISGCANSPEPLVRNFIKAAGNGDIQTMKECATGDLLKLIEQKESLTRWTDESSSELGSELLDISMDKLRGGAYIKLKQSSDEIAEVTVKLHLKNYTFRLTKVEGMWKISEIDKGLGGTMKDKLEKTQGIWGH